VKYRVPLLARTDFAAMFGALPQNQQRALKKSHSRLTQHLLDVSNENPILPKRILGKETDRGLDSAMPLVNVPALNVSGPPPEVGPMASLTIADWVGGITRGTDWLTPTSIRRWMKKQGSSTRAERGGAEKMLESFASLQTMDDTNSATPLAVFENRLIQPDNPPRYGNQLSFPEVDAMARHYLQFFINLEKNPLSPHFPRTRQVRS
jgi:hypothetical protein